MTRRAEVEAYILDFHERHAGATPKIFSALPAHLGADVYRSSYEILTSLVPVVDRPLQVVDLGCGSGYMLWLLGEREQPGLRLTGVDFSAAEIDVARHVAPANTQLLVEPAQSLSIATADADYVLSHLALMLMHDLPLVLAEIRRILRPAGCLAAVIGRRMLLGDAYQAYRDVLGRHGGAALMSLGVDETRSLDGWRLLLEPHFESVQFDDVDVPWMPTPAMLCAALQGTYDIDRLPTGAKGEVMDELHKVFTLMQDSNGQVVTGWGLRCIRAIARSVDVR